jgi:hypothetical protein
MRLREGEQVSSLAPVVGADEEPVVEGLPEADGSGAEVPDPGDAVTNDDGRG